MNLIGKHVNWNKINGKINASMQEKHGFGSLNVLELGQRMQITGDYGLTTTEVESIENDGNSFIVKTKNSTYSIKGW